MKYFSVLCLFFLFFGIVFFSSSLLSASEQEQVTVYRVKGFVQSLSLNTGTWVTVKEGDTITSGDRIRTLTDSYAELRYASDNNKKIRLNPNTHMILLASKDEQLDLLDGEIFTKIEGLAKGEKFEVKTPTCVVGARGTSWGTIVTQAKTIIEAYDHPVYTIGLNKDGTRMKSQKTVFPGEKVSVIKSCAPSRSRPITKKDIQKWSEGPEGFVQKSVASVLESLVSEQADEREKSIEEDTEENNDDKDPYDGTDDGDDNSGQDEGDGTDDDGSSDNSDDDTDGSSSIGGSGINNDSGGGSSGGSSGGESNSGSGSTRTNTYSYVCNLNGASITVIDVNDNNSLETIIPTGSGSAPNYIAVNADNTTAWVADAQAFPSGTMLSVRLSDNNLSASINDGNINFPIQVGISSLTGKVYAPQSTQNNVGTIIASDSSTDTISNGDPGIPANTLDNVQSIAIHPDGKYACVGPNGSGKIEVLDLSTNQLAATININAPGAVDPNDIAEFMEFSPNGDYLVASITGNDLIKVWNTSDADPANWSRMGTDISSAENGTNTVVLSPADIAIDSTSSKAYIAITGSDSVFSVELTDPRNATTKPLRSDEGYSFTTPRGVAITPGTTNQKIYITNSGTDSITILNLSDDSQTGTLTNAGGYSFNNPTSIVFAEVSTSNTITKTANKKEASVGDIITYTIDVHNGTGQAMNTIRLVDTMPGAFSYIKDSAYDSDGNKLEPQLNGHTMTFAPKDLGADERTKIYYSMVVNPGAIEGDYINVANATSTLADASAYTFNTTRAKVKIVPDPLLGEGTILGKVFNDHNSNGIQDNDENGIADVRIMMEDGTVVTTDHNGLYHIPAVYPETHLLKVDTNSLPGDSVVTTESPRTVRTTNGMLSKISFGVAQAPEPGARSTVPGKRPTADNPLPGLFDKFNMVALLEGEAALFDTEDPANILTHDDRYENAPFFDGRTAYYLDAEIQGDYSLVSSLDTARQQRYLMRNLDEDKYYPTYGDDSSIDYSATNTFGKFYAQLKKGDSYGLLGSYKTAISSPSLASYNKTLYGGKVKFVSPEKNIYGDPLYDISAFYANEEHIASFDRLRATGTSLYYLRHKNIVEGSETITIESQDKISSLSTASQALTRDKYDIDYSQGRIILKEPIHSIVASSTVISDHILNGDPVYINVGYEYESDSLIHDKNSGINANFSPMEGLTLGGTYINEDRDETVYELMGFGGTLRFGKKTAISLEYANSKREQVPIFTSNNGGLDYSRSTITGSEESGNAYSVNAQTEFFKQLYLTGYYKYVDPSFSNTSVVSTQGQETWGGKLSYSPMKTLSFALREDHQRTLRPELLNEASDQKGEQQYTTTLQMTYKPTDKFDLTGEYRHEYADNLSSTFYREHTQHVAVRMSYRLSDRLRIISRGQLTLQGKANNQIGGGIEYKVSDNTSITLTETFGNRGNSTLFGLSHVVSEDRRIYANSTLLSDESRTTVGEEQQINDTTTLRRESSIFENKEQKNGTANTMSVSKKIDSLSFVTGDYERSQFYNKGYWTTRDAVSICYSYNPMKALEFSTKWEYWYDKSTDGKDYQISTYNRLKYLINPDLTFNGKAYYSLTYDDIDHSRSAEFGEFLLGLAYRPVDNDKFNALAQYKLLINDDPENQSGIFADVKEDRAHIASVEGAYDINRYFQIVEKGALKFMQDKSIANTFVNAVTTLWLNRLNFHMDDKWNLGCEYRVLSEHGTGSYKSGFLIEIDRNITKYCQIGVGYNFTDFDDELSLNNGYTYKGWIFKMRGKY